MRPLTALYFYPAAFALLLSILWAVVAVLSPLLSRVAKKLKYKNTTEGAKV